MVNRLPRNVDDDYCVNVHIKWRKIHRTNYLRLPSHQTTPINSPSNLSDQPEFGFVISHSNKLRFASCIHTNRNRFNPPSSDLRVIRHVRFSSVIHQQPGAIS
ncbi:hypothetical protein TNCV_2447021 [Trichonephila clavipes]|nr:hypothetical protein TNCV_2447021 [Trichonephila clavipes]